MMIDCDKGLSTGFINSLERKKCNRNTRRCGSKRSAPFFIYRIHIATARAIFQYKSKLSKSTELIALVEKYILTFMSKWNINVYTGWRVQIFSYKLNALKKLAIANKQHEEIYKWNLSIKQNL